ncbi:AMP-binding protein [Pseudomonadales bacterium]|nr:AMP-binding protein [Pseudomonadales bacterium]
MSDASQEGINNQNCYAGFYARFQTGGTFIQNTASQPAHTYADLHRRSGQYANLLTKMGLKPGNRVMVQVEKSPECLFIYFACLRAQLIYLPLNTAYGQEELAYFIKNAEPALVVCTPNAAPQFSQLLRHNDCQVATLDSQGRGSLPDDLAAGDYATKFDTPATKADDIAVILYTSGTTGQPKGAMITHHNLLSNVEALHLAWGWQPGDVLLHALPIFHIHGLFVATHLAVFNASPIIFLPNFDPAEVIESLPAATVYMGVPTHYVRLLKHGGLDQTACRQMRLFTSGSAPLLPQTFDAFETATGHRIVERYGMTETGMNTSNPLLGPQKPGTVGPALPGVMTRIVDPQGEAVPQDTAGELQIRGPNVFNGYWRMPHKTQAEFTSDGYFKTGDLAQLDADGYIAIVGRSKDMIISGGLNVYPKEIETILDKLPGVLESAVIGLVDDDFGEAVTAVIVATDDSELDEAAVIHYMKQHLANFKIAKTVHFVPALPRNTMGKVQKKALRDQFGLKTGASPG